jgi:predicted ArsR family transcriptional regulator/anti-sigma regulatory factor (Ser/Thr protein kinase)
MEWVLDATSPAATQALRREFRAYIERHAEPDGDAIDGAEVVFGELTANVWRHAGGIGWVSVDWRQTSPVLAVYDLGPGFPLDVVVGEHVARDDGGLGLMIVAKVVKDFDVLARASGGTKVSATLPVARRLEHRQDRQLHRRGPSLPLLHQASPHGFTREPFLLALVVQLAAAVELNEGPVAAEDAVSTVGLSVGAQMETEYRRARAVVDRMTREQIVDCYVRLKHAIDGDFYLIDMDDDRIVLGNRRCPFGDVVRNAPSLCQMTSSVFGGIAAANSTTGEAHVRLEERIVVGDSRCAVEVCFGPPEPNAPARRYRAPGSR